MAKIKGLSQADLQLWAAYSQTIRLLPGKSGPATVSFAIAAATPAPSQSAAAKPRPAVQSKPINIDTVPTGLDKSTWKKFTSGKIRAAGRLDLHGHTAARAHRAVTQFVERAYGEQRRCVEIITGKGDVLARELPHWLNAPQLRGLILAIAHPHAANTGSVRILLRRLR